MKISPVTEKPILSAADSSTYVLCTSKDENGNQTVRRLHASKLGSGGAGGVSEEVEERISELEQMTAKLDRDTRVSPTPNEYGTTDYTPGWLDNGWINTSDTAHGITAYIPLESFAKPNITVHCLSSGWYTYGFFDGNGASPNQLHFNSFAVEGETDYKITDMPDAAKYMRVSFPLADADSFKVIVETYNELAAMLSGRQSTIESGDLEAGCVTTEKLSDQAVTAEKLAPGSVTGEKLALNAATQWNIADGAIVSSKIGDGQVTMPKISPYAYPTNQPTTYVEQLPAALSDAFGGPLKEFVVYGTPAGVTSVTVDIGGTSVAVDMKGETLYGIPDGARDELHYTDGVGVIWKRVGGERAVYLDELPLPYIWQNCLVDIIASDPTAQRGVNYVRNANFLATGGGNSVTDDQMPMKRIRFRGDVSLMTKDNSVSLTVNAEDTDREASVKWQGSSSLNYMKKNYTIKFNQAFTWVDGWGAQKKYVLKADWIDPSHLRNVVCAKLWGDVVSSRPTSAIKTKLAAAPNWGAIDGVPCSLAINGTWSGLYNLTIPKDSWMMGMGSGTQECILSAEAHGQPENFKAPAVVDGTDYDIEYVTDEDNAAWVKTSLNTAINAAINATSIEDIEPYIDVDSAIDYLIFVAAITGTDNTDKNYLLSTFDGTKWFFTAYDMDGVWGMDYMGAGFYPINHSPTINSYANQHRVMQLIKTYAKDRLKARYAELRAGALSEANIYERFTSYQAGFPKYGMLKDCELWNQMPGGLSNGTAQIYENARLRLAFLDKEVENL